MTGAIIVLEAVSKDDFMFGGRRSALDMSMFISGGSAALCEACFFANRIVRGASSGEKVQIVWQAWRFVTCDEN